MFAVGTGHPADPFDIKPQEKIMTALWRHQEEIPFLAPGFLTTDPSPEVGRAPLQTSLIP